MTLPNLWRLYNLLSSPFVQATLRQDSEATPLSLFVGRQNERKHLLTAIGGSRSSRQAVAGRHRQDRLDLSWSEIRILRLNQPPQGALAQVGCRNVPPPPG